MKYLTILLLLAFTISAVAAEPVSNEESNWFPLAVGNSWLFKIESFAISDGDSTFYTGSKQYEITNLLTHEAGFPIYELRTVYSVIPVGSDTAESYPDTTIEYLHQNRTELRCYISPALDIFDVWISFGMMNTEMAMRRESSAPMGIRVEESVTVPAGSFNDCSVIIYPAGAGNDTLELYFHQSIGPVKTVYSTPNFYSAEFLLSFSIQH